MRATAPRLFARIGAGALSAFWQQRFRVVSEDVDAPAKLLAVLSTSACRELHGGRGAPTRREQTEDMQPTSLNCHFTKCSTSSRGRLGLQRLEDRFRARLLEATGIPCRGWRVGRLASVACNFVSCPRSVCCPHSKIVELPP